MAHKPTPGYVYLFHASGTNRYKIGYTQNSVALRLKRLNASQNCYGIVGIIYVYVPDCKAVEKQLKAKYKNFQVRKEWFEFSSGQLTEVMAQYRFEKLVRFVTGKGWIMFLPE